MRILFVTSELAPLIKTGGLADVSAALPATLTQLGIDVRVLLPAYPSVLSELGPVKHTTRIERLAGYPDSQLLEATLASGVTLLALACGQFYERDGGPYQDGAGRDWPDNARRFGLL